LYYYNTGATTPYTGAGYPFGIAYLVLAFAEMYVLMPLMVYSNNLYMAALFIPIIAVIPALIANFSLCCW
jgi:hypothetical protein